MPPSATSPAGQASLWARGRRRIRWWIWSHRYLAGFVIIGVFSLGLESLLVARVFPESWNAAVRSFLAFLVGMVFAYQINARFNFRVPRDVFYRTFAIFALVSLVSYSLNTSARQYLASIGWDDYHQTRFVVAGTLFAVAYTLHRKFTFRHTTRNLGLAVYLSDEEDLEEAYSRVGDLIDHVHLDLVDDTFNGDAEALSLEKLVEARGLWRWQPFAMHLMSKTPRRWIEQCWETVDWFVIHVDIEDDVMAIIAECRQRKKKAGIVWHQSVSLLDLMPFLPHVDFVMILGIESPGQSGQQVTDESITAAAMFTEMASRYGFEVMFDGGVTTSNVGRISADYVVSNSTVLRSENPIRSALTLMERGP